MRMRTRVGRGVIVIGMIEVRVVRVIMNWMRLRWGMAINMIVILTIWKWLRSVSESDWKKKKKCRVNEEIGESGRELKVGGGGRWMMSLIRQDYNLPFCLPSAYTQTGPLAGRIDKSIIPSGCETRPSNTTSGPSPRGMGHFPAKRRRNTQSAHSGWWWWPGSDDDACLCSAVGAARTEPDHRGSLRV